MGAKVRVGEGESVEQALRRLRKWILKGDRWPVYKPKPTKRRLDYYQKPGELKRQRVSLAKTRQRQNLNYSWNLYASLRRWHERYPYV